MRKRFATARRYAQLLLHSRLGSRRPAILANSIPKSGTHLVKAILEGGGYTFVGHYGDTERSSLGMSKSPNRFFATAHITVPVTGPGLKMLVYRDPADVAMSMAIYIRTRTDHPRHAAFSRMTLPDSVYAIFDGVGNLEPLSQRYQEMHDWARQSEAISIDFKDLKEDPAMILSVVGAEVPDREAVGRAIAKWNPTKRTERAPQEVEIKHDLRNSDTEMIRKTFDVYKKIQSLT